MRKNACSHAKTESSSASRIDLMFCSCLLVVLLPYVLVYLSRYMWDMIQIFRSITRLRCSMTRRVCSRKQRKQIKLHPDGIDLQPQRTVSFILQRFLVFLFKFLIIWCLLFWYNQHPLLRLCLWMLLVIIFILICILLSLMDLAKTHMLHLIYASASF